MSRSCRRRSCPQACSTSGVCPPTIRAATPRRCSTRWSPIVRSWPPRCCPGCWKRWGATCPAVRSTSRCMRSPRSSSRPRKPVPSSAFRMTAGPPTTRSLRSTRRCRASHSTSAWCWPACVNRRARGGPGRPVEASDAFEAVRVIGRAAGVELTLRAAQYLPWHPGRCAEVLVGDTVVGHAGQLHPAVVERSGLPKGTCAVELDLDAIPITEALPAPAVSPFPAVFQDVEPDRRRGRRRSERWSTPCATARASCSRMSGCSTSTPARRSATAASRVTLALRFRAADRTLTEDEASAARDAAVQDRRRPRRRRTACLMTSPKWNSGS